MPYSGCLYEWFCSPNPLRAIAGHNMHDNFGCKQFGGTFLLGNGEITTSISASGTDPSGLGRWVWFSLSGHTGTTTHIISAYWLSNSSLSQTSSVRSQQRSYLLSQGDTCPPCDAFLWDLGLAIAEWQAISDQIILMADMNGDIRKPELSRFCTNLGLRKAILSAHPTLLPPVTFKQGNKVGKSPINGVWMSATLPATAASFCPISLSPGNHRAAILDLDLALLIGEPLLAII